VSVDASQRSPEILLRVAARAVADARQAWTRVRALVAANAGDDDANADADADALRAAYRACLLAARACRRAAQAHSHDASHHVRLIAEATRLDEEASGLRARLAKVAALDAAFA
jgi:hypothetical protein